MKLNERIKERRKELNKTLEEVAKACGVAKATVQRWESGEIKNIKDDKIEPLANALCTTPAYLMGWSDKLLEYVAEEDKEFVSDIMKNMQDRTVRLDEKEEALKTLLNDFGFNITKRDDGSYMLSGNGATRITKEEFERLLNSTIEYLEFNTKKLYDEKMYDADGCTTIGKK